MEQEISLQDRFMEVVFHTDPGQSGNGFRLDDEKTHLPVLREVPQLGFEDLLCTQGATLLNRDAWPFRQSGGCRESALITGI